MKIVTRSLIALRIKSLSRRAFTLLETAIVLGVATMIMSVLWISVKQVSGSTNAQNVMRQMQTINNAMRDAYTAVQVFPTAGDITATLAAQKIIPPDMIFVTNGVTTYQHAFSGPFKVTTTTFSPGPSGRSSYVMSFQGITSTQCLQLFLALPLGESTIGFEQVDVNGQTCTAITSFGGTGNTALWTPGLPLSTTQEATCCNQIANTGNLNVTFRLHP